jgi:hypothetical protein
VDVQDLLSWKPLQPYDVWHDRAVFHFLTEDVDDAAVPQPHVLDSAFSEFRIGCTLAAWRR